jgi:ABC-type ATPase fused to a predicted acetyltransferase domain
MKVIRVTEEWQRAGVHYVRTEGMVKDFSLTLEGEFEADTPESLYVLALAENLPVSTCRLKIVDASDGSGEKIGKIERVATIPDYRSKGIGSLVIDEAEKWLKEMGAKKVLINSRKAAVRFYEKLGYKPDWNKTSGSGLFECVETEKIL